MILILTRHGSTAGNEEGRIQDQLSGSLSEEGREQARLLGIRLADMPIDCIYTSDALRTLETTEILLAQRSSCPVHRTPLLRERHFGEFIGVMKKTLPVDTLYLVPKSGESLQDVYDRVQTFALDLLQKHPEERVLLVGHGLAHKVLLAALRDSPVESIFTMEHFGNTSVTVLDVTAIGQVQTILLNDTSHLGDR